MALAGLGRDAGMGPRHRTDASDINVADCMGTRVLGIVTSFDEHDRSAARGLRENRPESRRRTHASPNGRLIEDNKVRGGDTSLSHLIDAIQVRNLSGACQQNDLPFPGYHTMFGT